MKRTLLVTIDFPPRLGGVARYYANLCQNLPSDDLVVLTQKEPGQVVFDSSQGYKIIRKNLIFRSPFIWPKWLPLLWYIFKTIKEEKIELMQVGEVLPIGTVALIFNKIFGTAYIIYFHGMDILVPLKLWRKKILFQKILKNATKAIVSNTFFKKELIKLGAQEKDVVVVWPCPNLKKSEGKEEEKLKIINKYQLKEKKILLTVGRLVRRKGHEMIIKALGQVLEKVPNLVYLIVGEGPYRNQLSELSRRSNLNNKVIFIGQVLDKELSLYYELCDLFVMIPRELPDGDVEGFGLVYLEANLFGKPVIGSRSGGVEDAVIDGQTGFLVEPNDLDGLVRAIIILLVNQNLANKFGVQGRERVLNDFKWAREAKKIEEILG